MGGAVNDIKVSLETNGFGMWQFKVMRKGDPQPLEEGAWVAYALAQMDYTEALDVWGWEAAEIEYPDDFDPDGWLAAETGVVR